MAVLITGANGLIGSKLAMRLAESGTVVHALCRSKQKLKEIEHPNIKVKIGDITDNYAVADAMEGCSEVYHLAAYTNVWHKDKDHYYRINVTATKRLIEIAKLQGVRSIVVTSTAGVMGYSMLGNPVDESVNQPKELLTTYDKSKFVMEQYIINELDDSVRIVIVNPSRIYGPGLLKKSNSVTGMIIKYLKGKWFFLPGNGESIGNYAYIDDVVEGHILAMIKGRHKERYILGGENLSYIELFKKVSNIAGYKHKLYKFPLRLMLIVSGILLIWANLTGTQPLIIPDWVRKYNHNWILSVKKAQRELNYNITSYEDGVRSIIKHYFHERYNKR